MPDKSAEKFARVVKVKAISFAEPQFYFDVGIGNQRMNFNDTETVAQQRADYINELHENAVQEARNGAIEESAKICDELQKECDSENGIENIKSKELRDAALRAWGNYSMAAEECATRIRALRGNG